MKKFTLKRPIRNASDTEDITEVSFKDEKDISACDFYNISFKADGSSVLGSMANAIANLCGLTEGQVAELHIKDYISLSAEVGSFLE